jgi:hypothetical protein
VRVGAEAATVDECFEAILRGQGMAFTQVSSRRFCARPGLAFVPVADISPTSVAVAWRRDACAPARGGARRRLALVGGRVPDSTSRPIGVPAHSLTVSNGIPSDQVQPSAGTAGGNGRRP